MEFHSAAQLFPLLEGVEYEAFKEDIRQHGQQVPIDVWNGVGLDGRNRYRACCDLGIEVKKQELTGNLDPIAFVVSRNLHRRHLNESQRGMIGAKVKDRYEAEAKERKRRAARETNKKLGRKVRDETLQANLPEASGGQARDKAAEVVNVAPRTIEHASKVLEVGTPSLARMVEEGKVAVSAAATVAHLPTPEQEEVVSRGPEAVKAKAKELREKAPPMPPEDKDAEARARRGEGWHKAMHDLWRTLNGVRDFGGMSTLSDKWDRVGKEKVFADLERIKSTIDEWISVLKQKLES